MHLNFPGILNRNTLSFVASLMCVHTNIYLFHFHVHACECVFTWSSVRAGFFLRYLKYLLYTQSMRIESKRTIRIDFWAVSRTHTHTHLIVQFQFYSLALSPSLSPPFRFTFFLHLLLLLPIYIDSVVIAARPLCACCAYYICRWFFFLFLLLFLLLSCIFNFAFIQQKNERKRKV